jgi:metal-responsive CopG/Arc/MetJ family transcriptional regulator
MKPIQVMMDDRLLARLDADAEVQRVGRSAVLRRAVEEYLRRRRADRIADAYRRAYGEGGGLGPDWTGWEDEGAWPEP